MSQNFSKNLLFKPASRSRRLQMAIGLLFWVMAGLFVAEQITTGIVELLNKLNVSIVFVNKSVFSTIVAAFIYILTLGLVIGLPWLIKKHQVTRQDIGLQRLPNWTDILMAPAGFIVYLLLSAGLIALATALLPWFDVGQVQNTSFGQLNQQYEGLLAFFTLVVIAPVAEEVLFRGYLLGKLKKFIPVWLAIIVTSLLFGFVHGAWNLALDTFALSIILCLLRVSTGSLWASILLHMIKNGVAFYILFINPTILHTLGG